MALSTPSAAGSSCIHGRYLQQLFQEGPSSSVLVAYLRRAQGGRGLCGAGGHSLTPIKVAAALCGDGVEVGALALTCSWKSALPPRLTEVRAAQINANLLTANKHIKWKLIKEIYFKETSGAVFLCSLFA